jgi:ribulose-phosphate 3-epimerase
MVSDVKSYIDDYRELKPVIITFHYEAVNNHRDVIDYIKSCGIKVGMAIKPDTMIEIKGSSKIKQCDLYEM